jgi:hypothetical protein
MNALLPRDIAAFDFYHCSFMVIVAMIYQGTDICCHGHQQRRSDFRGVKRLIKYDHLIVWHRPPQCPKWMGHVLTLTFKKTRPELVPARQQSLSVGCRFGSQSSLTSDAMTWLIISRTQPRICSRTICRLSQKKLARAFDKD